LIIKPTPKRNANMGRRPRSPMGGKERAGTLEDGKPEKGSQWGPVGPKKKRSVKRVIEGG